MKLGNFSEKDGKNWKNPKIQRDFFGVKSPNQSLRTK